MSAYTQGNFGIAFKVDEEMGLQWYRSMDGLSEEQEERLYEDRSINREECQSDWFIYDPRTDEWNFRKKTIFIRKAIYIHVFYFEH